MRKFFDKKDKVINCPNCGAFLTKADSQDRTVHKIACKKCKKWIWYNPSNDKFFKIREIPERTQSSGKVFY